MSDGTHNDKRHMYHAVLNRRACVETLQFAPAGDNYAQSRLKPLPRYL